MNDTTPDTAGEAQPTPPSPPPAATADAAPGPAADTAPPTAPPPAAPPSAEAPPAAADDDWDEEDSILTWKLLVACAVVLGVIAVGAYLLFNGKKKDSTTAATSDTTPAASATEPPAIRDDFDRPDNADSLGKTTTGEDWQAVLGKWGVSNKQALVVEKNSAGPRNIAVIETGSADGAVGARAAKLGEGWGLVFRYRGPNAYWSISWVEQFKTFRVTKMENGKATDIDGGVPVPNSKEGMDVRIEFVGPLITFFVDGKPLRTLNDGYLKGETKVGLYVQDKGVPTARWSDFIARKGLTGPPITAPPSAKDKPKTSTTKAGGAAPAPKAGNGSSAPSTTAAGAAPGKT